MNQALIEKLRTSVRDHKQKKSLAERIGCTPNALLHLTAEGRYREASALLLELI